MTTRDPGASLWTPGGEIAIGSKGAAQAEALATLNRSVIATPPGQATMSPSGANFLLWAVANRADGITPWGMPTKQRDWELRNFWPTENLLASAVAITTARNAALSWKISGDEKTALAAQEMVNNANFGGGWEEFVSQTSIDLYTQDAGAFVGLVRESDSPLAPVIGFHHLDAARCYPTGNPEFPVIYEDTNGRLHRMPWYLIVQLLEMPSPITPAFGGFFVKLQYCAVTRVLRAAQVLKSIAIYKDEKVSGRFLRALHLISGVDEKQVQDAIGRAQFIADSTGAQRYSQPAVVASVDPNAAIKHDTIEMSSLPDGWNEKETLESYVLALSMGFLTDYQEFAPLPGGGLGTASQSETLHAKARGRGPGLFQKLMMRLMNQNGVLPSTVLFEYDETDIEAEGKAAENRKSRVEGRALQITSGEIDTQTAREIALEVGDLSQAQYDELMAREQESAAAAALGTTPVSAQPDVNAAVEGEDGQAAGVSGAAVEGEDGQSAGMRSTATGADPDDPSFMEYQKAVGDGVPFGHVITSRIHRVSTDVADDAHGLGYFETPKDRIAVSGAIGPALALFEEALRDAGVWDIVVNPEDADRLVLAAEKAFSDGYRESTTVAVEDNPQRSDVSNPIQQDRLDYEAEAGVIIAKGLRAARDIVRRRMAEADTSTT